MELNEALEKVNDEASFLVFAKALLADREDEVRKEKIKPSSPYGPGANGWENGSIEAYIESAIAWAEDSNFGKSQEPGIQENPWKQFAVFLYCGKIYE